MKAQNNFYVNQKTNYSIEEINLGYNAFGLEGSRAVADCIKYNKVIKTIFLNNNRVTYDAARIIADSLRENSTLRALDVNIKHDLF